MSTASYAVKRPLHVFIDGGFFEARLRQAKQFKRSVKTVREYAARHLLPGESLHIWYYDARPFEGYGRHPLSKREFHFQEEPGVAERLAFFEDLRRQEGLTLRLGQVSWQQEDWQVSRERMMDLLYGRIAVSDLREEDVYPSLRQKGVDLLLGLDLAEVASSGEGDRIVLVAGDADFLPVLAFARRQGLKVVFDALGQRPGDDFKRVVDEFKTFVAPKGPAAKADKADKSDKAAKPKRGRGKAAAAEDAEPEAEAEAQSADVALTFVDEAVAEPGGGSVAGQDEEAFAPKAPAAAQALAEGEDDVGNRLAEPGDKDAVDGNRLDVPVQGTEVYANIHAADYVPPLPRYPTRSPRGESILEDSAAVAMQTAHEHGRFGAGGNARRSGGDAGRGGNFSKRGSWRGDPQSVPEDIGNRAPGYERQARSGEGRGNRPAMPRRGGKQAGAGGQQGQGASQGGGQGGQGGQGAQAGGAQARGFKKGQPRKGFSAQGGKSRKQGQPQEGQAASPSKPRLTLTLPGDLPQAQAQAQPQAQPPQPAPKSSAVFLDKNASQSGDKPQSGQQGEAPAKPNKKGWREQAGFEGKSRAPRRKPREAAEGGEAAPAPAPAAKSPKASRSAPKETGEASSGE